MTDAIPQSIAMFENGEARGELHFVSEKDDDEQINLVAEDDLYDYLAEESNKQVCGTIYIHNKKDGTLKAVPVQNVIQIKRSLKIHQENEDITGEGTAGLVRNFGTRAAKRIMAQRMGK